MTLFRPFLGCAVSCLLLAPLPAQSLPSESIQGLLPPDAKVIETADLSALAGKPRQLVLWMRSPQEVMRNADTGYCGDTVYGDHWVGPTRLSLVDSKNGKRLNTVEIVGPAFLADEPDSFRIPFLVGNYFCHVPHVNSKNEGRPTILNLRDFTGDGVAAE